MTLGAALLDLTIKPLQLIFETVYSLVYQNIQNPGLSIIALSLVINLLVLPLYRRADAMQEEERETEAKLSKWVAHIKKNFRGDERTMMLQTYYRQNNYSPTYVLRSAVSLFLEIPFFIAAYQFLSHLTILEGVSFGPIADLSQPDALVHFGNVTVNVLPILMTLINFVSSAIFTKGYPLKSKIQLYAMAAFFLFFLYDSPSALVFYWTLNNLFSLIKTIFYKLKNPRFVLRIISALAGCALIYWAGVSVKNGAYRVPAFVAFLGLCLFLPGIIAIGKKHGKFDFSGVEALLPQPNRKVFFCCALFLAVLTGALIPSSVIKASPQEFISPQLFVHPMWYIAHSFLQACGLFLLWFGVFYWLFSPKTRSVFDCIMCAMCGIAVVDYLFFGTKNGLIMPNLAYEADFVYSLVQIAINGVVVLAILALLSFVYVKRGQLVRNVVSVAIASIVCMSAINCFGINQSIANVDYDMASGKGEPHFTLSKTEENVVVIMLDRGMGTYIPYLFNEKPELKERFAGFTYYSNVISYGSSTNVGSPSLYGGYEYRPVNINMRDQESLEQKQNEALKVMPVLFDSEGFDVTVFDPTYAGYEWIPDLSIYDAYEGIQKYISNGYFTSDYSYETLIASRNRNFFLHGLMKIAPLFAQKSIYNYGGYNACNTVFCNQTIKGASEATGIRNSFADSYYVLKNMPAITEISDKQNGSFLMMSNDTTHDVSLLAEPEYVPAVQIDNREYDKQNQDRFYLNGRRLRVETGDEYAHYQCNMAALLLLADWFDYLRDNGAYDNTRIILVSDHGRNLRQFEELIYEDASGSSVDLESFMPMLMVKDFYSTEFCETEAFMTNADVPTLATAGVVSNPINPMTGCPLNNSGKYEDVQYILTGTPWETNVNNGNTFMPGTWLSVHDDAWDQNNWSIVSKNAVFPDGLPE